MGWEDRAYNRDNTGGVPPVQFQFPPLTRLTIVLLSVNLALFILKAFGRPYEFAVSWGSLMFLDGIAWWQPWRWITYQYLHGSGGHVFFNMIGLYFFLPSLELRWGWAKAFGFYTLGGIFAGFTFFLIVLATGTWGAFAVGASGCVLACLGAVALLYPDRKLIFFLFALPIRVAAVLLAVLYILTSVGDKNLADFGHLGGLVFGFCAPWLAGPLLSNQQEKLLRWRKDRVVQAEIDEQRDVDRILAKVAEHGMQSLTGAEKRRLAQATANQQKRDAQRAKRYQR